MTLQEVSRWSDTYLASDMAKGGKFVVFNYAISIIAVSYKRASKVYYIPSYRSAIAEGWKYLLISLLLGWWGIPWGPIYTIQSIINSFSGIDITAEALADFKKDSK
jgi:hypothetical protein